MLRRSCQTRFTHCERRCETPISGLFSQQRSGEETVALPDASRRPANEQRVRGREVGRVATGGGMPLDDVILSRSQEEAHTACFGFATSDGHDRHCFPSTYDMSCCIHGRRPALRDGSYGRAPVEPTYSSVRTQTLQFLTSASRRQEKG